MRLEDIKKKREKRELTSPRAQGGRRRRPIQADLPHTRVDEERRPLPRKSALAAAVALVKNEDRRARGTRTKGRALKSRTMTFPPAADAFLEDLEDLMNAECDRKVGVTAVIRALLSLTKTWLADPEARATIIENLRTELDREFHAGEVYRGGRRSFSWRPDPEEQALLDAKAQEP